MKYNECGENLYHWKLWFFFFGGGWGIILLFFKKKLENKKIGKK
jgi:hypothetical protein